jgi:hypothetical protein
MTNRFNNVVNFHSGPPRDIGSSRDMDLARVLRTLERIEALLRASLANPETLAERRFRLERDMAAIGLKPSDYEHWQLVVMGYEKPRKCRPKGKK